MKRILMIVGAAAFVFSTGTLHAQQKEQLKTKTAKVQKMNSTKSITPQFEKIEKAKVSTKVINAVKSRYKDAKIIEVSRAKNDIYRFKLEGVDQANQIVFYKDGQVKNLAEAKEIMKAKRIKARKMNQKRIQQMRKR